MQREITVVPSHALEVGDVIGPIEGNDHPFEAITRLVRDELGNCLVYTNEYPAIPIVLSKDDPVRREEYALSLLEWGIYLLLVFGQGRECFYGLWDAVDTSEHNVSFEEVLSALKELLEHKLVERVPGWETEWQVVTRVAA